MGALLGLASALAPAMADAGNAPGAAVGAIRWDTWVGDRHPYGLENEYTLGPSKWSDRLPFYAVRTGPDTVQIRQLTQAQMDQDIAYANRAGLDYWAFCWYPEGSSFDIARNLYKSSTQRGNLKFAHIIGVSDYPPGSVESVVADLGRSYYQKVLNGRPLVYIFDFDGKTRDFLALLRQRAAAAGLPPLYVAVMHYDSATAASVADQAQADAITAYMTGPWDGVPYSQVISENQSRWGLHAATGRKVIPWVTVGVDNRPRNERPASFLNPVPPPNAWAQQATAAEVATNLQNALNWIVANPTSSDANAVLMYAWNEFDEGGWLTPTLAKGTDRIEAVSEVLRYSSSSNWDASMTANKAFDGSMGTAWQSAPNLFAGQWIEVDFGRDTTFSQATLREYGDRTRGYRIEYLNGTTWRTAYTGTTIGASSTVPFAPVTGRKARLYFTSGIDTPIIFEWTLNSAPSQQSNLALHESYSSSSNWDSNQTADKAFDGDPNTNWQGRGASFAGTWLAVDFGVRTAFNTFTLSEYGDRTSGYRIEYWNGSGWATAHTGTVIGASSTVTFPTVVSSRARIYFTAGWGSPIIYEASISLKTTSAVLETRQSLPAASSDVQAGHVFTASSQWDGGHAPYMAFDQSTSNFSWGSIWASNGGPFPQWVQRRLPASAKVYAYRITHRNDGYDDQAPSAWHLQGSNDGSTWSTLDSRTGIAWSFGGQTQTFTLPEATRAYHTHYRLLLTAASGSTVVTIAELELLQEVEPIETAQSLPAMTDSTSPWGHEATASSSWADNHAPYMVFDQNTSHFSWGSIWASNGGPFPQWVQRRLPSPLRVATYRITNRGDGWNDQDPSAWHFQGSNDGAAWTTLDSRTGVTWPGIPLRQGFTLPAERRGDYTYYRLLITAASGSTITTLAELELLK